MNDDTATPRTPTALRIVMAFEVGGALATVAFAVLLVLGYGQIATACLVGGLVALFWSWLWSAGPSVDLVKALLIKGATVGLPAAWRWTAPRAARLAVSTGRAARHPVSALNAFRATRVTRAVREKEAD